MRQIKFRKWCPKQRADNIPEMRYFQVGYLDIISAEETGEIAMQFTGFQDKNGNEIYEGDILRQRLGRDDVLEIPEFIYIQVVFDKGCFREHSEYDNNNPDHYFLGDTLEEIMEGIIKKPEIEIIGNIWENPDIQKKYINPPRKRKK